MIVLKLNHVNCFGLEQSARADENAQVVALGVDLHQVDAGNRVFQAAGINRSERHILLADKTPG